jgi:integrase
LVTLANGDQVKQHHLRLRFDTACCRSEGRRGGEQRDLTKRIKQFQFRDIRAKSASEISDMKAASELLGHTEEEITGRVYRRVGQAVAPTR